MTFVECAGPDPPPRSTLSIDYVYVTGEYNYYEQDANRGEGTLNLELDQISTDLTFADR